MIFDFISKFNSLTPSKEVFKELVSRNGRGYDNQKVDLIASNFIIDSSSIKNDYSGDDPIIFLMNERILTNRFVGAINFFNSPIHTESHFLFASDINGDQIGINKKRKVIELLDLSTGVCISDLSRSSDSFLEALVFIAELSKISYVYTGIMPGFLIDTYATFAAIAVGGKEYFDDMKNLSGFFLI